MVTSKNEFQILLKLRLRSLAPKQRKALATKRPPRWLYPVAIEHSYARDIETTMRSLVVKALERIEGRLVSWIRLSSVVVQRDGTDEELQQLLEEMDKEIAELFAVGAGTGAVLDYVESVANRLFAFEKMQMETQTKLIIGTPLSTTSEWWPEAKKLWVSENHRLIKSLGQEYIAKLNTILQTGFQSGWTFNETVDEIKKLSDKMTGYRARLIARDQVGKLQYAITRNQFESIGMDGYIWTTARDELVRGNPMGRYAKAVPSHWIMDGMVCKFSDPTVFMDKEADGWQKRYALMPTVHPGQAILCRCTCTPYWLPIVSEVNKTIE